MDPENLIPDNNSAPRLRLSQRILLVILAAGAFLALIQTIQVVRYPYETEVWEGNEQLAAMRVATGTSPYGWPESAEYPSRLYSYPPFFPILKAAIRHAAGIPNSIPTPGLGRTISALASFGCALCLYLIVFARTRAKAPALIAGLMLLAIEPHHRFLNVDRPDALGTLLTLLAYCCLAGKTGGIRWGYVLCTFLASITKQPYLAFCLVGLLYTWGRSRKEAISHAIALALLLACFWILINHTTHLSFWRDAFRYQGLVTSDTIHPDRGKLKAINIFVVRLLCWSLIPECLALWHARKHWSERYSEGNPWIIAYVGVTAIVLASLLQWGAFTNRLVPAVVFCNVLFGFALAEIGHLLKTRDLRHPARVSMLILLSAVPVAIYAAPLERIPDKSADLREMEMLELACRTAPGPVLSEMPLLAVTRARLDAFQGLVLLKPEFGPWADAQIAHFSADVLAHRFAAIVLYPEMGKPCAFVPLSVYRQIQLNYRCSLALNRTKIEVWVPRP